MIGRSKDTRSNPLPTQDVFKSANQIIASKLIKSLIEESSGTYLVLSAWLEDTTANNSGISALSASYRKRLRTISGMRRFHTVGKQQNRVIRISPNRASCFRRDSVFALEESKG